jgi:GntR family transcriptional repressor for pyruvate dehydrogenase complex
MLGIVEVRRGVGTYVRRKDQSDAELAFHEWTAANQYQIIDLFEVRMSLEATAAALAAQRATDSEQDELTARARAHLEAHIAGDIERLVDTDQAFHEALVRASQNEALGRVYSSLVPQLVDYRRKSLALEGASMRSSHDHLTIVEAIRARQPEQARGAALAHLSSLYREVIYAGRVRVNGDEARVPVL